jgi:hypothetical protein
LTGGSDRTAWLRTITRFGIDYERIALWAQITTGMEADELGNAHVLDTNVWQMRRKQFEDLGGPPIIAR